MMLKQAVATATLTLLVATSSYAGSVYYIGSNHNRYDDDTYHRGYHYNHYYTPYWKKYLHRSHLKRHHYYNHHRHYGHRKHGIRNRHGRIIDKGHHYGDRNRYPLSGHSYYRKDRHHHTRWCRH